MLWSGWAAGSRASVFSSQRPASSHDLESAIRQTVEAYTDLSRDKVGALMVFERRDLLDDVIKTGTPLDCSVTGELLKNLFWNKAPPPRRRGDRAGGPDRGGGLYAAPVRQCEPEPGPGDAPPGGHPG